MLQSSKFINSRNFNLSTNSLSPPPSSSPSTILEPSVHQLSWYTTTITKNRTKSFEKVKKKKSISIPFKEFQSTFKYTKEIAMKSLGLSPSEMNSHCKKFNIKRWPYRRVQSIKVRKSYINNLMETQGVRIMNSSSSPSSSPSSEDITSTTTTLSNIITTINSIETEINNNPSTTDYNKLVDTIILPIRKNFLS